MNQNIALNLPKLALEFPNKAAVKFAGMRPNSNGKFEYQQLTFSELENRSLYFAHRLLAIGLRPGMKVLMFVRPSLHFSAITFALFRAGLVPIFIDPGMGKENLLRAIEQIQPDGLIAEKQVHWLAKIYSKVFKSIRYQVTISGSTWWNFNRPLHSIEKWIKESKEKNHQAYKKPLMQEVRGEDSAAILFTSGGTGIPKGVLYTHDIFNAQVESLQALFHLGPEEIDLPGFPLFSLFTITMGMTSAIPSMDPSHPAQANPEYLVKNILDNKATFLAGSPAIWKNVATYCRENKIVLPSVKYLVMFGAPIPLSLHESFKDILPNGDSYTPYGATECLPVANISGKELEGEISHQVIQGRGTCVGSPAPHTRIEIIEITDDIIGHEDQMKILGPGQLGEICILSRTVTPEYVGMADKTAEAKIQSSEGKLWHRMGDIGFMDHQNRLWFCGRKSHLIRMENKTIPTIPIESIINQIPGIKKSALICPIKDPIIVIEGKKDTSVENIIRDSLANDSRLRDIKGIQFLDKFPVDIRHNIKIDRLKITELSRQGKLQ
jgi:olefin beta-lactone synthetase